MQILHEYDKFVGPETLKKEYKVPSMNYAGTCVTDEEAVSLIKSNKFIFNQAISNNIKSSFDFYFGKYFTAFMNSNLDSAEFYYGINDYGIVTGFPYQGDFSITTLENYAESMINGSSFKTNVSPSRLKECYQINLIKINYNYIAATEHFKMYQKQELINQKIMQEYYYKMNLNMTNHMDYSSKLISIITNPVLQKELLKYIYNKLEYKDIKLYYKIRNKIKRGQYIKNLSHGQIFQLKYDITNVYYWVTRFKDRRIKFLKSIRPIRPIINTKIYPNCLLSTVEHMIPNWMNNNENMNLYLIKISFSPKKLSESEKNIKYLHQGEYNYCVRSLDCMGNPCCKPL